MLAPLLWRNIAFDPVAEEDHAYFILVVDGGEGKHSADLGDEILFTAVDGTEQGTGADIHEQQHGQFPLFFKKLAEGVVKACGDIPVDKADIIPGSIFPYFAEAHPPAFEGTMVFPGKKVPGEPLARDIQLPDLLQYFSCCKHGLSLITGSEWLSARRQSLARHLH